MADYDIGAAFAAIEHELIASMIRNLDRHRAEEDEKGFLWSQWQVEQLKSLELYKVRNRKKYEKQFQSINKQIEQLIEIANQEGNMEQEAKILEAIKNGFKGYRKRGKGIQGEFFKLNERKLDALIKATIKDMERAETAILRMAEDKYRQVIFNAQVYANAGAGTYEKAVDMATHDMLAAGLNCVEYAGGARHTLKSYASMALRTATKRAYLQGEGAKRQEWGVHTVIMNKRGNPCPKCLPFVGKVLIDDVWSGGSSEEGEYPLMSAAVAAGLYHPNCRDSHTTYFPGISTPPDGTFTRAEIKEIEEQNKLEAKQQYAERQAERVGRLAAYSLDEENKRKYAARESEWAKQSQYSKAIVGMHDKYFAADIVNEIDSVKIKSGAVSGARNPYGAAAGEHAQKYYGLVRSMKTDVKKIAKTTGYPEEIIQEIKNYIFIDKHDLGEGGIRQFDPDYMISESWRRLMEGKPLEHDLTLIRHEIMEKDLIKQGMSQDAAHIQTSRKYNYEKEADEYYGKIKKYKKE